MYLSLEQQENNQPCRQEQICRLFTYLTDDAEKEDVPLVDESTQANTPSLQQTLEGDICKGKESYLFFFRGLVILQFWPIVTTILHVLRTRMMIIPYSSYFILNMITCCNYCHFPTDKKKLAYDKLPRTYLVEGC